jgi:hypothetical protein
MAEMTNTHWNGSDMEKTVYEKKYIYKEDHNGDKEYASKGVGGTALGIGIGALALTLLGRNGNILNNVLGNPTPENQMNSEFFQLYKSQVDADFAIYKGYRDADDLIIAKHNADAFSLYKYSRDGFDALQGEISDLKTKLAVQEAVQPWKDKAIYDAIALESERRCCADNKIVNYANLTFYPVSIADVTVGTTSTPRTVFNPLCGCC